MRLTPPLNLPAPGRRQALYVTFTVLQSPVFLLNSRLSQFTVQPTNASGASPVTDLGTPSPEVTGLFCRVPSPELSRAPEATRLAYLCRFMVRSVHDSLEAFLGTASTQFTRLAACFPEPSRSNGRRICLPTLLRAPPCSTSGMVGFIQCVTPLRLYRHTAGAGIFACFASATPLGLALAAA